MIGIPPGRPASTPETSGDSRSTPAHIPRVSIHPRRRRSSYFVLPVHHPLRQRPWSVTAPRGHRATVSRETLPLRRQCTFAHAGRGAPVLQPRPVKSGHGSAALRNGLGWRRSAPARLSRAGLCFRLSAVMGQPCSTRAAAGDGDGTDAPSAPRITFLADTLLSGLGSRSERIPRASCTRSEVVTVCPPWRVCRLRAGRGWMPCCISPRGAPPLSKVMCHQPTSRRGLVRCYVDAGWVPPSPTFSRSWTGSHASLGVSRETSLRSLGPTRPPLRPPCAEGPMTVLLYRGRHSRQLMTSA